MIKINYGKLEQRVLEVISTGNEIWGRLLNEVRTCLLTVGRFAQQKYTVLPK